MLSVPDQLHTMNRPHASTPWLVARCHRIKGLQRVDLFWGGSGADGFDVYRDGQRIATVSASPYHDRLDRDGSGSYRYHVAETATAKCSNDAAVTFTSAGRDRARVISGRQATRPNAFARLPGATSGALEGGSRF